MRYISILFCLSLFWLFSCVSEDTTGPDPDSDDLFSEFSWSSIALEDTLVFALHQTESGGLYAFTGLEVFYSASASALDFAEITELRGRSGFLAEPNTEWHVSIDDSTVWYARNPGASYATISLSGYINSAILENDVLYLNSQGGLISSLNLNTHEITNVLTTGPGIDQRMVSKIGNTLYLRQDAQIRKLDLTTLQFEPSNLPTVNISQIVELESGLLIAATANERLLVSADNGVTWQNNGPTGIVVNPVTDISTADSETLYLSFLGSGVFVSPDSGRNWFSQNNEQLDPNVYSLLTVSETQLLAATSTGIYLRTLE